jgi:hypothetical protein
VDLRLIVAPTDRGEEVLDGLSLWIDRRNGTDHFEEPSPVSVWQDGGQHAVSCFTRVHRGRLRGGLTQHRNSVSFDLLARPTAGNQKTAGE